MSEILKPSDLQPPDRGQMEKITLGVDLACEVDVPSAAFIIFNHFFANSDFAPTGTGRRNYAVLFLRFTEGDGLSIGSYFIHTTAEAVCRLVARLPSERAMLKARVVQRQSPDREDRTYFELIDAD